MAKILARLSKLMKLVDVIDDLIEIGNKLKAARADIQTAGAGQTVDAGEVKGIKAWGRTFDLPLRPRVR